MHRRAIFTDLDKLGFEEVSYLVPVQELHLDESQLRQNLVQKSEVVERQEQEKKKSKKRSNVVS